MILEDVWNGAIVVALLSPYIMIGFGIWYFIIRKDKSQNYPKVSRN